VTYVAGVVRLLASVALTLIGNAIGLVVAALLLDDMSLSGVAFVVDVVVFTVAFVILRPLTIKLTMKHSSTLAGGSALVATLAALIVADVISDGLTITGVTTWILATLIIWIAALVAGVLLPLVLFKKALARRSAPHATARNHFG
jgi:putative membrane protein